MPDIIYDAKTEQYTARIEGESFDQALDLLAAANLSLIPAHINTHLRRKLGPQAFISKNGNYTAQGIFRTNSGLHFTNNSPVLVHPREATAAHRIRKPYIAPTEDITRALTDAVEITEEVIPLQELPATPIGQFLFREEAEPYARFLWDYTNIREISICVSLVEGEAVQLWFGSLGAKCRLGGSHGLSYCTVRGVRVSTAGASPNSKLYSPEQIIAAFEKQKLPGLERILGELRENLK